MATQKQILIGCLVVWLLYVVLFNNVTKEDYSWILKIKDDKTKVSAWITSTTFVGKWSRSDTRLATSNLLSYDGIIDLRVAPNLKLLHKGSDLIKGNDINDASYNMPVKIESKSENGEIATPAEIIDDTPTHTYYNISTSEYQTGWTAVMKLRDGPYNDGHSFFINMRFGDITYEKTKTIIKFNSEDMVPPPTPFFSYSSRSSNETKEKINNLASLREYDTFTLIKSSNIGLQVIFQFDTSIESLTKDILNNKLNGSQKIIPIVLPSKTKPLPKTGEAQAPEKPQIGFNALDIDIWKQTKNITLKAAHYSAWLIGIAIIIMYGSVKLLQEILSDPNNAKKYSITTQVLIMSFDQFICVSHFVIGQGNSDSFHYFLTPSLWFFIVFAIQDFRIISYLWRITNQSWLAGLTWEEARQKMFLFNCKVYLFALVSFVIFGKFIFEEWFIIALSFLMLPQIMKQAFMGQYFNFDLNYLTVWIPSRFLVLYYHKACPYNLLDFEPMYSVCQISVTIIVFQIGISKFQSYYGPQSIIPEMFSSGNRFNYFVKKPEGRLTVELPGLPPLEKKTMGSPELELGRDGGMNSDTKEELPGPRLEVPVGGQEDLEEDTCAICMNMLSADTDIPFDPAIVDKPYIKRLASKQGEVMRAPCKHTFHISCLVNWMQVKLECPSCRKELPSLV